MKLCLLLLFIVLFKNYTILGTIAFCKQNKKNTQLDIIPYTISIDLNVFTDGQDLPQINMLSVEVLKEGLLNDSFWE